MSLDPLSTSRFSPYLPHIPAHLLIFFFGSLRALDRRELHRLGARPRKQLRRAIIDDTQHLLQLRPRHQLRRARLHPVVCLTPPLCPCFILRRNSGNGTTATGASPAGRASHFWSTTQSHPIRNERVGLDPSTNRYRQIRGRHVYAQSASSSAAT